MGIIAVLSVLYPNYLKMQIIKNTSPFTLSPELDEGSKGRLSMVRQAHHERNSGYHEQACFVKPAPSMVTGIYSTTSKFKDFLAYV